MKRWIIVAVLVLLLATTITATAAIPFDGKDKQERDKPAPKKIRDIKIVIPHDDLVQVIFIKLLDVTPISSPVTDVGDPDNDGNADGYELLNIHWNLTKYPNGVPYVINPKFVKKFRLDETAVVNEMKLALEAWDLAVDYDDYTPPDIATYNVNLFDEPTVDYRARVIWFFPDGKNVITWRSLPFFVVAITIVWYNPANNEVVEADMILNYRLPWGIDPDDEGSETIDAFDIQNIVTHEAGHWCGLDDIYDPTYEEMTMYGFTTIGETKKISLEPGDIAGVQVVYDEWRG